MRILIGDDPVQTPLAEQAFLDAIAAGGAFIPDVVLAEVGWVLRGYGLERSQRHALLHRLVRTRGVAVVDVDGVIDALGRFLKGGDFADHLLLARASSHGALPVLSFDQRFACHDGVEMLG
ncbi:PIN domain-containing protein [Synechococcus sp. NB0720_010]|uniref:PIN domain-containing protein n=1 Tax=Synechococcus sp. NB0720_010 TaxID=2907159 RepID=UPI001FF8BDD6|nr:PIN domain-containing protein [Synechococcus sp. NB0720_010]UPH89871.1 PIN domain-containing protein [Synechococcus sp. NB0720_010]